jgi:hypothetical protein
MRAARSTISHRWSSSIGLEQVPNCSCPTCFQSMFVEPVDPGVEGPMPRMRVVSLDTWNNALNGCQTGEAASAMKRSTPNVLIACGLRLTFKQVLGDGPISRLLPRRRNLSDCETPLHLCISPLRQGS